MKICTFRLLAVLWVLAGGGATANALTIVPTFDSTITSDPNAATIEAGINNAIAQIDSYIANPVTDNITFVKGTSGLGESSTYYAGVGYSSYRGYLQNNQTLSASDSTAIASLPAGTTVPTNNNASTVNVSVSLLRALGQFGAGDDSTITLNTSIMNLSRTGTQNSGFYDLESVALHEISETLGAGGIGSTLGQSSTAVGTLDLFRYNANGVRSYSTSTSENAYFSINGGATNIRGFNQSGGGADYADWASGGTPHVQDAFGTPGAQLNLASAELTALDVVGYNLTAAGMAVEVPEPTTVYGGCLLLGGAGVVGIRKRFRRPA